MLPPLVSRSETPSYCLPDPISSKSAARSITGDLEKWEPSVFVQMNLLRRSFDDASSFASCLLLPTASSAYATNSSLSIITSRVHMCALFVFVEIPLTLRRLILSTRNN